MSGNAPKIKSKFRLLGPGVRRPRFLRVSDVVPTSPSACKPLVRKKQQRSVARVPAAKWPQCKAAGRSVLDMLLAARPVTAKPAILDEGASAPKHPVKTVEDYIRAVTADIASGRSHLHGDVWVMPPNPFQIAPKMIDDRREAGERHIDGEEALTLAQWPSLFVWAPELSSQGCRFIAQFAAHRSKTHAGGARRFCTALGGMPCTSPGSTLALNVRWQNED